MVRLYFDSNNSKQDDMDIVFHVASEKPFNGETNYTYMGKMNGSAEEGAYAALIAGLRYLSDNGHKGALEICGGNAAVIRQINGTETCRSVNLDIVLSITKQKLKNFLLYTARPATGSELLITSAVGAK